MSKQSKRKTQEDTYLWSMYSSICRMFSASDRVNDGHMCRCSTISLCTRSDTDTNSSWKSAKLSSNLDTCKHAAVFQGLRKLKIISKQWITAWSYWTSLKCSNQAPQADKLFKSAHARRVIWQSNERIKVKATKVSTNLGLGVFADDEVTGNFEEGHDERRYDPSAVLAVRTVDHGRHVLRFRQQLQSCNKNEEI